ncbi:MAG: thioredoxin domain-containing protein [Nocardioidaceae bacterium]|nr:thioredoxin domain-containing protein [Nocardioidaceae bacterium]NUS50314.1 thioredoxin domain-containing protein [Nocardioidaceae bacterium]
MSRKKSTATRREESRVAAERAAAIRAEQERRERRRRALVVGAVVIAVLVIVGVIATVVSSQKDTSGQSGAAPAGAVANGYAVPAGPATAKTTITVYEDFMCPFCGQFEAATRSTVQKGIADGSVQMQYHVLNFLDGSSTSEYSTRSANALAVVLDTSGPEVAKKFHDLLFENQPEEGSAGLSDGKLLDLAVQAGAPRAKVSQGISDRRFDQWVDNVTDRASKDGVTGTPTVLINGKKLESTSVADLAAQVDKAVATGG